ncbi:MAG TPA: peptidoglycan-binding protein, partial [Acidimicrobiales bacterium]|nr:peptidoglycan-binding protein [Acidimicrobiales bacterium]
MTSGEIHLDLGAEGPAVADLQHRLERLGIPKGIDVRGRFGPGTRAAVEAFQHRRGLRVDGVCGPQTWSALVEAGCRLGDRFLYRRSPMLRGDDVAELQQRLSALGFDTGRVDGIFGDQTSAALGEFQRNVGLPVDHIAGADTVRELLRFGTRHDDSSELVTSVRDHERLRQAPRTLAGQTVAIGEEGGLGAAV